MAKNALLLALAVLTILYIAVWIVYLRRTFSPDAPKEKVKLVPQVGIGFFANFMDTLGVGSFALTSSIYKLFGLVQDDLIPGTMNVGHALPTAAEAFIFIGAAIVPVEFPTLISMIAAAVVGEARRKIWSIGRRANRRDAWRGSDRRLFRGSAKTNRSAGLPEISLRNPYGLIRGVHLLFDLVEIGITIEFPPLFANNIVAGLGDFPSIAFLPFASFLECRRHRSGWSGVLGTHHASGQQ